MGTIRIDAIGDEKRLKDVYQALKKAPEHVKDRWGEIAKLDRGDPIRVSFVSHVAGALRFNDFNQSIFERTRTVVHTDKIAKKNMAQLGRVQGS